MITAQFNDSFPPIADGVAYGVKNYALWLNRKYGKSYAVVPEFPGYTDNEEFEVIRFKSIPLLSRKPYRIGLPDISFEARKRIMELPLDIIHVRSPFSAGIFASQIAAAKDIPLIASFHSQYYFDIKEKVKSEKITVNLLKGIARFYEKADAVWTVNEKTAGTLRSYGYNGIIDIIGNGIDLKFPNDYEDVRESVNKEYGIGKNEFLMLYVGQLVWHKNLRFLSEGLLRVKNAGKSFKMMFVGEGAAKDGLKDLISELGLEEQVIFTGKITDRQKVMSIYARGDLFLFPSIYDTFGIVVREAAALLCPCLMIEGTNAAQGIIDLENGFLCSNDNHSFASVIMNVMDNRSLLKKVAKKAAETLPESWESVVDKAYVKYQEVIRDYSKKTWRMNV